MEGAHSTTRGFELPDCEHDSIWPATSDPYVLGLDRPHRLSAGFALASSSRSRNRRADARSLRSATESLFRSREDRDCRRQEDPRPRRGAARSCPHPADRSRPPTRSIVAYATPPANLRALPPCGIARLHAKMILQIPRSTVTFSRTRRQARGEVRRLKNKCRPLLSGQLGLVFAAHCLIDRVQRLPAARSPSRPRRDVARSARSECDTRWPRER